MAAKKLLKSGPNYQYQVQLVSETIANLKQHGVALLASSTGSGKTDMAIKIIQDYLKKNPKKKVLFLAHGTTTLRDQVARRLQSVSEFSSEEIVGMADVSAQVHVAIPQNKLIRTQKYGLVVVDEAHQYYDAKMVQDIISNNAKAQRLLLTASSGKFTQRKVPAIYFSLLEALDAGTIMEPSLALITTKQNFRIFDSEGNLSAKEKLKEITSLVWKLRSKARGKTLIACHNQDAARDICKALGKTAVYSTTKNDSNNIQFKRFIDEPELKYLVVVFKGVIGFSMDELETVVDLTASQNIDRITQLMGRIVRLYKGKKPVYVKLAPAIDEEWYQHVMSGVMMLAHPTVYRAWNGRLDSIEVPVTRTAMPKTGLVKGVRNIPEFKPKTPTWTTIPNMFTDGTEFVKLSRIRGLLMGGGKDPEGKKEELLKIAKTGLDQFGTNHSLYPMFRKYTDPKSGCFDEFFLSQIKEIAPNWLIFKRGQTKEECLEIAKKYGSRREWELSNNRSYSRACKFGWMDELSAHMVSPKKRISLKCSNGKIYVSMEIAAKDLGVSSQTVNKALKNGNKVKGFIVERLNSGSNDN